MGRGKGGGGWREGGEGKGEGEGGEKVGQKRKARRQEVHVAMVYQKRMTKKFETGELVCQRKHAYCMDGSSK